MSIDCLQIHIFSEEKTAEEFGRKSMKRTEEFKVVEYTTRELR